MGPLNVADDLARAGFIGIPSEYRLAPPHDAMNEPNHQAPGQNTVGDEGHYPKQSDDCRAAVRAARAHPRCDGRVYCIGGSAGASHAMYMAARGKWGDDKPDLVVLCSGVYQFDDEAHLKVDYPPGETNYHDAITNYVDIPDTFPDGPWDMKALRKASPLTYAERDNLPPIFALISSDDSGGVDTFQFPSLIRGLLKCGMTESQADTPEPNTFKLATVPVIEQTHAFKYWNLPIENGSSILVRDAVITWLKGNV
jgi:hypothetical protein